jgi:uncharacterized protein involved in high-affinity Fe2+ transport
MSSAQQKTTLRMVVASFAAGVGAMTLVGLAAPLVRDFATREALASTLTQEEPATIQPLDVAAVRAQLVDASQRMETTRAATSHAMSRLERLSGQ